MKYNLVCFDMDGVILNSMPTLTDLAVESMSRNYILSETLAKIKYQSTVGMPFLEQLHQLFPADRAFNEMTAKGYEGEHCDHAASLPLSIHAQTVINSLRSSCSIALVTSTDRKILLNFLPQVRALGFDFLGGYRAGWDKAAQIQSAMAATSNLPEQTILFGDSELDAFYAAKAGVNFRMLTHKNLNLAVQFAQGGK